MKNCIDVIKQDLKDMDITWEEAGQNTEQDGVNVWTNALSWMQDEPR